MQNLVQGSQEWLQMRREYLGASDAPVIMGVSPYKTRHQLWEEKLGIETKQKDNRGMIYGREMEQPAREAYEKLTGILVVPAVVFHKDIPYMMASLDGLSMDKSISVEIKNVNAEDHETARQGKVPVKYFPQVQHQLEVLGHDRLHYFSYRNGDSVLVEVSRDEEYLEKLLGSEESFWQGVVNFKEPSLSSKDYITLDSSEWVNMASEWQSVNDQLKALTAKEKECRQAMIDMANDQNVVGGGVKLTKVTRKGLIDYSKIIELNGIDLEQYRKEPIVSWRVS